MIPFHHGPRLSRLYDKWYICDIFNLMGWLVFTLLSAFFNSLMDLFTKLSSGKIHEGVGATLICFFAAVPTLMYVTFCKFDGREINISKDGVFFSALAGLTVGIATIFALKMFATGVNLSVAIPILRISMILIATFLGLLVFKERMNWKSVFGLILSFLGIYLIINAKA